MKVIRGKFWGIVFLIGAAILLAQITHPNKTAAIPSSGFVSNNDFQPKPSRIKVSSLNIDAPVINLGLNNDGTLEVPKNDSDVGWYTGSPSPGGVGPAVMVGHLDSISGAAVFYKLKDLKPGDEVSVEREDGSVAVFKVDSLENYSQDNFPTDKVYGPIAQAGIRLITCSGTFSRLKGHYSDNLVVYGTLVKIDKS